MKNSFRKWYILTMSENLIEKRKKLYSKLASLERDYDELEDYENLLFLEKQIELLVDQISSIEEAIDKE